MLVVFSGNNEVLVCQRKDEKRVIQEWLEEACRNVEDYDREEMKVCTLIRANLYATGE